MIRIEKVDGVMHIEGLAPRRAMEVREAIEHSYDAIATLKVTTGNDTVITVRGAHGEALSADETPEMYRAFVNGFVYAREPRKESWRCGCRFRIRTVRVLDKHCGGHAHPPEEEL